MSFGGIVNQMRKTKTLALLPLTAACRERSYGINLQRVKRLH